MSLLECINNLNTFIMKNLLKGLVLTFALLATTSVFGQTLQVDNASGCIYELYLTFADVNDPCGPETGDLNTNVTTGSNTYTVPAGMVVQRAMFIGCCGSSDGSTVVSFFCGPTVSFGEVECGGLPVTFNFVQDDLIEVSN